MQLCFFWLILIILLIIVKLQTNQKIIWLLLFSGVTCFICSLFNIALWLNLIIFGISFFLILIITKIINKKRVKVNLNDLIGKTALVTKEIKKNENGEITISNIKLEAKSMIKIPLNKEVIIEEINDNIAVVHKKIR